MMDKSGLLMLIGLVCMILGVMLIAHAMFNDLVVTISFGLMLGGIAILLLSPCL